MNKTLITLTLVSILFGSCTIKLQTKKITYNDKTQRYEYQINKRSAIHLRNEQLQLIDTINIKEFRIYLEQNKNNYLINNSNEKDGLLKKTDSELAVLYRNANQKLIKGEYREAINKLNKIEDLYSDINKFSDFYFLKAYAFEESGRSDSADFYYTNFLNYSSQTYTNKFRGNRDIDIGDSIYINERNYAAAYLLGTIPVQKPNFILINPKYYYGSYQPGYTYNPEDSHKNTFGTLMYLFGTDFLTEMSAGVQLFINLNKTVNIIPRFFVSPNLYEFSFATPLQVYKSENNNIGVKFTPYIKYLNVRKLEDGYIEYIINENVFSFGGRLSAGYYPYHNFSIGAYYQYNFFNEQNRLLLFDNRVEFWQYNEYDLSAYYNIFKGISLKAGVKNNDIVAGLFLSGWEISYNFTNPGIVLGVDMY